MNFKFNNEVKQNTVHQKEIITTNQNFQRIDVFNESTHYLEKKTSFLPN